MVLKTMCSYQQQTLKKKQKNEAFWIALSYFFGGVFNTKNFFKKN